MSRKVLLFLSILLCVFCTQSTACAAEQEIWFSHESGFYEEAFTLKVESRNRRCRIFFTLDGSNPGEDSLEYSEGVYLDKSNNREDVLSRVSGITAGEAYMPDEDFPTAHVVRAVAIYPDGSRSEVINGTFFVGYDRRELYGDIAIMLLVTEPDGFFEYDDGIYILGKYYDEWQAVHQGEAALWEVEANYTQSGMEWERPVNVTYLTSEGTGFSQNMGVRIKGGATRHNNQKSLRFIARKEYGENKVSYEIFADNIREADGEMVNKYKSFTLRNGGNDAEYGRIRDPYISNLATGMRFETAQNMPCIAFLNGEYWGVYTINEEYTDKYIQYHYGIDSDQVIVVKCGKIEEGEDEEIKLFNDMFYYIAQKNMSEMDNYHRAAELLDMRSFADYCALQLFIVNQDGIFQKNNWEMWRTRESNSAAHSYADGKWRMMLYDTDYSSGIYVDGKNAAEDNVSTALDGSEYQGRHPGLMFVSLMKNELFKELFIQACSDICNLYFTDSRVVMMWEKMSKDYLPYVPDTLRRFGPARKAKESEQYFASELEQLRFFFIERNNSFLGIAQEALGLDAPVEMTVETTGKGSGTVYMNGRTIPMEEKNPYIVFCETALTVTADPDKKTEFKGWTVSGDAVLADPNALTTVITFNGDFTLTANFE